MNHRRFRIERGAHVRHRFQFLVFNGDEFGGVLGDGAAGRHDGRDRLALPADAIDRDRVLRRRFEALQMREHADPWRDDGRQVPAPVTTAMTPGNAPGRRGVDPDDLRMGMGRAQKHHMRHPRQFHVADIKPPPLHQPLEVGPRDHLADIGVRPVEHRERLADWPVTRSWLACPTRALARWSRPHR